MALTREALRIDAPADDEAIPANRPRFSEVLARARALQQQLSAEGYDDGTVLDALESETYVLAVFDRALERIIADELLAETAKARAKRLEARAAQRREFLEFIMAGLNRDKLDRPLGSPYLADDPPSVEILGPLPAKYRREVDDKLKLLADLKAGLKANYARLSPPTRSLRIRKDRPPPRDGQEG